MSENYGSFQYDIFISYKSENANIVRQIVETLVANGIRIWFAEYKILLYNYDEFQTEIDKGIDSSKNFLIFTNDSWADSEYCNKEINRIIKIIKTANDNSRKIIEVQIPKENMTYKKFPEIKNFSSILYMNNFEQIVKFIIDNANIGKDKIFFPPVPPSNINMARVLSNKYRYCLNVGDFIEEDCSFLSNPDGGVGGFFKGKILGNEVIAFVQTYLIDPSVPHQFFSESGKCNDRDIYHMYRKYAKNWVLTQNATVFGLHLFFHSKRSNMALSFRYKPQNSDGIENWERTYGIFVKNPLLDDYQEIRINFKTTFSPYDPDAFKKFCSLTKYYDSVVSTLKYLNKGGELSHYEYSGLFSRIIMVLALTGLEYAVLKYKLPDNFILATFPLFWIYFMELSLFCLSKKYRHLQTRYLVVNGQLNINFSDFENFSQSLFTTFITLPLKNFLLIISILFSGALNPLGIIILVVSIAYNIKNLHSWLILYTLIFALGVIKQLFKAKPFEN